MRKAIIVVLATLALVLAFGGAAPAAESRPAIGGRVLSISGTRVVRARVHLRNATTGFGVLVSDVTSRRGEFSVSDVPPGPYEYFVVTARGAYLGRQTIDTTLTPRVTVDLTIGPPARGEELPRAEQFPESVTVQPVGYAEASVVRGLSRGAKARIAVGASVGGLAFLALVINALDSKDEEPAATVILTGN